MQMDFDTVIIGAGVIGLAIARRFALDGQSVLILEKEPVFGSETSARNSEVIHAGIYYPAGSLKARLCVSGKALLYDYCAGNNVPYNNCGKLIVAANDAQLDILQSIEARARANGVNDLRRLDGDAAMKMEPALDISGALLSPSTGIIDSHGLMLAFSGDLQQAGADLACNSAFEKAVPIKGGYRVHAGGTDITCRQLINAAGLHAQSAAKNIESLDKQTVPQRYLAKGSYFTASGKTPFSHLIYPVPDTASLGVHVTLDMAGQMRFGPDQQWIAEIDYEMDPARADNFYAAVRQYYPGLKDGALQPAYCGIRPKIQAPGDAMKDFDIQFQGSHHLPGLVNLYGMESPGLTSCLAIGEYVFDHIGA